MENVNNMKYLVIFKCEKLGFPITGWKFYNSQKEWEEVLNFHKERKVIDFKLFGDKMIKYDSIKDLMEDIDAAPVIDRAFKTLDFVFNESMISENTFGYYPL